MQIDLHHAMTWVVARAAGFEENQAATIAHAAQYVDDATHGGSIQFDNGASYERIATAHKMIDYRNLEEIKNLKVWLPFHFLPGNGGKIAGENPSERFIHKLVCKPNSYVARDMVNECIADKHRPYALHRLGITSHVFIDTWGHQGFAGVQNEINEVSNICKENGEIDSEIKNKIIDFFKEAVIPNLGHGQALSYPDLPYLNWSYTSKTGETVIRKNPVDFLVAANELCKVYQKYQGKAENGLSDAIKKNISYCFTTFTNKNPEERHKQWKSKISEDFFNLGSYQLEYIEKGIESWKHKALGMEQSSVDDSVYKYRQEFLNSDWKLFHDAAKKHRLSIVQDILPQYGICVS